MTTIFVTNPLRALQLENQRLRREIELLRQQLAGERQELGVTSAPATAPAPAAPRSSPASVALALLSPPAAVVPASLASPASRTPPREPTVPAPGTRPVIHLFAMDPQAASAPRPNRADPETLDDAAMRFRLLELD